MDGLIVEVIRNGHENERVEFSNGCICGHVDNWFGR